MKMEFFTSGGPNEFGYIEPDSSGLRRYVTLTDRLPKATNITSSAVTDDAEWALKKGSSEFSIGEILSLVIKDSRVYFLSARSLIIYDSAADSLSSV
ncbi:MAG: hypothetical protein MZV63_36745 [Marinilabiliales bacterium]|nr:hypothetical protein [Marinilabiliales bacterium]